MDTMRMITYLYRSLTLACTKCGKRKKFEFGKFYCPKCETPVITLKYEE